MELPCQIFSPCLIYLYKIPPFLPHSPLSLSQRRGCCGGGELIGNVDAEDATAAALLHQQHFVVIRVLKGVCIIISCCSTAAAAATSGRGPRIFQHFSLFNVAARVLFFLNLFL